MAVTELDLDELAARATGAAHGWAPGCSVRAVEPLTGGASSLTFTAAVDGGPATHTRIVLKVAPPGLEPVRNRDVARQARLMRALDGASGVRVPTVLFEDDGAPPETPPFHAMNLLEGECVEPILAAPLSDDVMDTVPGRAFAAAEMLAALHRVVPEAVGLGDEPVTTLQDEIERWQHAFGTVDARLAARQDEAASALLESLPSALPTAVCHGDYRLGNMLCQGDEITAIIDWELWSPSDPRLDLAWFLFFTDEAKHPMAANRASSGMPSADALLERYVEAAGATPADMEWFHCLIRYKEAAATALIYKRMLKAAGPAGLQSSHLGEAIPALTVECIERLGGLPRRD
ncbi:MAG: phosphotransferase family protein [Acidimicrobiia bacterium]